MQLESLKIFCDVVRRASFSRGAKDNGISQSSASQVVHQLAVRLAAIYSVGFHHMSRYVERFRAGYPAIDVQIEYAHPTRVVEGVLANESDLGLISYPRKWPDLVAVPWRTEEMVLAVHPSHRLAGREQVDVEEIDGESFVGFDGGLPIRREVDRFLRRHGVHVRVALEFDNIETIKRAVEVPSGVAILPAPTLTGEVRADTLRAVRFRGEPPTRPLAVVHRRGDPLSLASSRFLAFLTADADPATPAAAPAQATGEAALKPAQAD